MRGYHTTVFISAYTSSPSIDNRSRQRPGRTVVHRRLSQLTDLLSARGLSCRVHEPTHELGGLLDVVATRDDLPISTVQVIDV